MIIKIRFFNTRYHITGSLIVLSFMGLLLMLTGLPKTSYAVDFEINGFGSIVAGKAVSDESLPDGKHSTYLVVPTLSTKDNGQKNEDARYDDSWSLLPDSNFGLQISALTEFGLSGTVQLTAQGAERFDPDIEWAYLSYDLTENLRLNVGRQRIPLYYYSEYLNVGYAYHWLRPPVDVYGEGVSTYDGISLLYSNSFAEVDYEIQILPFAESFNKNALSWRIKNKNGWGVVLTSHYDWLTLRANYIQADSYIDTPSGLVTVPKQSVTRTEPSEIYFAAFAVMIDSGDYFFGAEITHLGGEPHMEVVNVGVLSSGAGLISETGDRDSFMVTGGYRYRDFTWHATYSERQFGLSVPADPRLQKMNDAERRTWIFGVRWDFHDNMAFKAEVTQARDKSDKALLSVFGKSRQNTVFAFGIDYAF